MLNFIIILLSLIMLTKVFSAPPTQAPPLAPAKAYIMALQWPVTVCLVKQCKEKKTPPPESFKLHGLWPCAPDWDSSVENCPGPDFSGSALKDIRGDLLTYWPSLLEPENQFWKHEWLVHGTCSGLPLEHYFADGVRLTQLNARPILSALSKSGIKPGDVTATATATPIAIRDAIANNFGVHPKLACAYNNNMYLLKEIHLCLDQNYKFEDCPDKKWLKNCGPPTKEGQTKIRLPSN
ncbi:hypothetical protein RND81_09G015200 [Saponaria officinalis]|uniref:Uncharacterized protein n=1 Tax=Saponaria officinalis TaxID=3572 RepID=A0AAW1IGS5_SAPOF